MTGKKLKQKRKKKDIFNMEFRVLKYQLMNKIPLSSVKARAFS